MTFAEVFSAYWKIILEFLFELYVFYFLVTKKLNRSKYFAAKVIAGIAAIAVVALGVAVVYCVLSETVWGRIAVYVFLFILSSLHIRLCFDEPYKTTFFCCCTAYAAQNLTYKLFLFVWCFGEWYKLFDGWGAMFDVYYRIFYYIFFAAAVTAIYFAFIRSIVSRLQNSKINFRMLFIAVLVLGVTVIMCSFEDVYFARLSVIRENRYDEPVYYVLRQTGNAFSIVCLVAVLLLIHYTLESRDLRQEIDYMKYTIRQSERQYEISRDTIDLINIKCHDIKYKINSLLGSNGAVTSDEVKDLCESVSIYDSKVETGYKLLDVLLTEKSLYCEQNGIIFSCMADGAKLAFMSDGDLYSLFGNIADNALEAVCNIAEQEKRVINLSVFSKNDMLFVQEENYFSGERQFKDGLPETTKNDKDFHGFGMRSIRMIVHKYDGELSVSTDGDIFRINIIFGKIDSKLQNK